MINSKLMNQFLKKASDKLTGEWIVIGGTVLPLMGIDHRITIDIDIINLKFESSNNDSILLMEIAEELHLPIESINQAGAYYLSKIENFNDHLITLIANKNCRIFRPDAFLFIKLKIDRMSESDLSDCLMFIKKNVDEYNIHKKEIEKIINKRLKNADHEIQKRLNLLLT